MLDSSRLEVVARICPTRDVVTLTQPESVSAEGATKKKTGDDQRSSPVSRSPAIRSSRPGLHVRRYLRRELQVVVVRRRGMEALVRGRVHVLFRVRRRIDRAGVGLNRQTALAQLGVDLVGIEWRDAEGDVIHHRPS